MIRFIPSFRCLVLILSFSVMWSAQVAPAKANWIIQPDATALLQERLTTAKQKLADRWVLQGAAISRDRIHLRYGLKEKGPSTINVTLLHPKNASDKALKGPHFALEPKPGPAPQAGTEAIMKRLNRPFKIPVWTAVKGTKTNTPRAKPKPIAAEETKAPQIDIAKVPMLLRMGDRNEALQLLAQAAKTPGLHMHQKAELALLYRLAKEEKASSQWAATLPSNGILGEIKKLVRGVKRTPEAIIRDTPSKSICQLETLGQAHVTLGDEKGAIALLEAVYKANPKCLKVLLHLTHTHLNEGEGKKVIAILQPLIKPGVDDRLRVLLAHGKRLEGDLAGAISILETLVDTGRADDSHIRLLITMYLQQKAEKQRIADWKERAAKNPNDSVARVVVGTLLHYRDKFKESSAWLEPVKEAFATNPRYQIYRAMNAFNLGEPGKARDILDAATRFKVTDPDVYYCRGEVLRDTEREQAIQDFKRYMALTDGSPFNLPEKQERVETQIRLLTQCLKDNTAVCDGPWEHPRGGLWRWVALNGTEAILIFVGLLSTLLGLILFIRRKKSGPTPD